MKTKIFTSITLSSRWKNLLFTTVKYAPSLLKYFRASNFTGQASHFTWQAFAHSKICSSVAFYVACFCLLPFALSSQAPQGFNYQAVARDSDNAILANTALEVKIGLLQGSETGTLVWEEIHLVTTGDLGLFTLTIGDTTATSGSGSAAAFADIYWTPGSYYMKVQVDDGGGYVDMGAAELLSVPYALFAEEGNEGPAGPQGDQGTAGATGEQGETGPAGAQGVQGATGPEGPQGPAGTGLNNQGSWSADSTYYEGDYVFDRSTGDPLINSMWIFQGTPPHSSSTQPYQDTDNWVEFEAPEGPEGPEGPQGVQGPQGAQGIQGEQGLPGDPATDDQTLSIDGHDLTISGGNMVTLPDSINDDDADPTNEIQDLQLSGHDLSITNKTPPTVIDLSTYLDNTDYWTKNGDTIYVTGTDVGIGTTSPGVRLQVKGETSDDEEPLFEVKNKDGQTVFAVYNNGVRVYVDDSGTKGLKGGFAVGGFGSSKGEVGYMMISPDSVRFYIDTANTKGLKGGFAVGGFNSSKGVPTTEYLRITDDSVRIYLNNSESKGLKGGFAVGGFNSSKGIGNEYFRVTQDSVRVYLDTTTTKGLKGGFAVGGFGSSKGINQEFLRVTKDSVRIYISEETGKGLKGGFAVGGFNSSKGLTNDYFNISGDASAEIINNEPRVMWYPKKSAFLAGEVHVGSADSVGTNSTALGYRSISKGDWSQAFGYKAMALNTLTTAIGKYATASGESSYAFGDGAKSIGQESYAFGSGSEASGLRSYAFGSVGIDSIGDATENTKAIGDYSFAFGLGSVASGQGAFAMGTQDTASGLYSTALGYQTDATDWYSTAMGYKTTASDNFSTAMGKETTASGFSSTAMGYNTTASGNSSTAMGYNTTAIGTYSTAMGYNTVAGVGSYSIAMGNQTNASGNSSTAMGYKTTANYDYSTAMGKETTASGFSSTAMGDNTTASGNSSTAMGRVTTASAFYSTAMGAGTTASGNYSTAMGWSAEASGNVSTAMGYYTTASGEYSIATGREIEAQGDYSFAIALNDQNGTIVSQANTMSIMGGNVGIGTVAPGELLEVDNGSTIGTYTISGWQHTSDKRLKTNIHKIPDALEKVLKINGVYFNWKSNIENRQVGFIAQDIEDVIPEIVSKNREGYYSISYGSVTPILVEAIKEQQEIIESQQSQIDKLEKLVNELINNMEQE